VQFVFLFAFIMKISFLMSLMSGVAAQDVFLAKDVQKCDPEEKPTPLQCDNALDKLAWCTALMAYYTEANDYMVVNGPLYKEDLFDKVMHEWDVSHPNDPFPPPDHLDASHPGHSEEDYPLCTQEDCTVTTKDCEPDDDHENEECGCALECTTEYACAPVHAGDHKSKDTLRCIDEADSPIKDAKSTGVCEQSGRFVNHQVCRVAPPSRVSRRRLAPPAAKNWPQVPAEDQATVQQMYYDNREWLDNAVARYEQQYQRNFDPPKTKPLQGTGSNHSQELQARRLQTVSKPKWTADYEPIVDTPWFMMLWSFLDEKEEKLISGFRKFEGAKSVTLWTGDHLGKDPRCEDGVCTGPNPKTTKAGSATFFGKLFDKFTSGSLYPNCGHNVLEVSIWNSASRFFVKQNPQQKLNIIYRQSGFATLTNERKNSKYNFAQNKPRICWNDKNGDHTSDGTILWEEELTAWIGYTADYCDGVRQGIPDGDPAQKKIVAGDITIFVETSAECREKFKDKNIKKANGHDPCVDLAGAGPETQHEECTEDMVKNCECAAAKAIKERILEELTSTKFYDARLPYDKKENPGPFTSSFGFNTYGGTCRDLIKESNIQCKPLSELPDDDTGLCREIQRDSGNVMYKADQPCPEGTDHCLSPQEGPNCMWCVYDMKKCKESHPADEWETACQGTLDLMTTMGVTVQDCKARADEIEAEEAQGPQATMQGVQPSLVLGLVFMGGAAGAGAGAVATYLASRQGGHA
jgi:hypothetical protein